jgi:hypothetical protein
MLVKGQFLDRIPAFSQEFAQNLPVEISTRKDDFRRFNDPGVHEGLVCRKNK